MASFFSKTEEKKKNSELVKLAKSEFELARGSSHLKMLKDAQKRYTTKINESEREINRLNAERIQVSETSKIQLRQALERHLISTRITEIPGIGNAIGSTILYSVYKGNLTDLYRASAYQGIGDSKQYGINAWVQKYQNQIPVLLLENFPGKVEIIKNMTDRIESIENQIKKIQVIKSSDEENLKGIVGWVEYLSKITVKDFINARINHAGNFAAIETYINGVFPEWEPMPDWFKNVIAGGNDVR